MNFLNTLFLFHKSAYKVAGFHMGLLYIFIGANSLPSHLLALPSSLHPSLSTFFCICSTSNTKSPRVLKQELASALFPGPREGNV